MKLIQTVIVGAGGAANIEFTSIPQTYTDLYLVVSGRNSGSSGNGLNVAFNSNTSSYTNRALQANGSGTSSYSTYNRNAGMTTYASETSNTFGLATVYIFNYTSSNNKSYSAEAVSESNGTTAYSVLVSGLWGNTSAISSLYLSPMDASNFVQYSSASLYGILKGSGGATAS